MRHNTTKIDDDLPILAVRATHPTTLHSPPYHKRHVPGYLRRYHLPKVQSLPKLYKSILAVRAPSSHNPRRQPYQSTNPRHHDTTQIVMCQGSAFHDIAKRNGPG